MKNSIFKISYYKFREVFYVESPVLVVPKLYININSCVLRVVDNDTGEQMPMVFMRVTPRVLHKNKVCHVIYHLQAIFLFIHERIQISYQHILLKLKIFYDLMIGGIQDKT